MRRNVIPVDSLWLPLNQETSAVRTATAKDSRYWICEIPGGDLIGGDWVVSSPLGDFDTELPARVPISNLK